MIPSILAIFLALALPSFQVVAQSMESPKLAARLPDQKALIYSATFSPDGELLALASRDGNVSLWKSKTGKQVVSFKAFDHGASVAFHPRGRSLASTGTTTGIEDRVRIWDLAGKETASFKTGQHGVCQIVFAANGKVCATAGWDGTVKLWDAETHAAKATIAAHEKEVYSVAITHDGALVASAGIDHFAKIWDCKTQKQKLALEGHKGRVLAVAFSPNEKTLASGDELGVVKLWDVDTGKESATLLGHRELSFPCRCAHSTV